MKVIGVAALLSLFPLICAAETGQIVISSRGVTGTVNRHEDFQSKFVDPRNVDIWLPPDYEKDPGERFPVVYMHDGQNLFDPKTSFIAVDWGVDETMTRLITEGKVRRAIVVGIWNTPKRLAEYMPQKAVKPADSPEVPGMRGLKRDQIVSDNYLKFLVEELKPFVDATCRTKPERQDTFIMGSSMGGLISAYALMEYPNVFGGAGCVSTHWPAGDGTFIAYLEAQLPKPGAHKFYFDHGTETTDASYEGFQQKVDALMKKKGYVEGQEWLTKKFVGAEHSERAWRQRVDIPLTFFLAK